MEFKVHDGTVSNSSGNLCTTCRHSIVTRGQKLDEEIVWCRASHMGTTRVTFRVSSCSAYFDQREPTYLDFVESAWILRPGSKRRPAGFVRAKELGEDDLANVLTDIRRRRED